ncbi:MAG TPA: hypothetical protein DEP85_00570, partial [Holosporales bacterium]|nr:hypothetical protein [Holosporales bacterium]
MIYKIRKVICYTTILAFLNTSFQPIYATPPEDFGEKPSHHSVTLKPNPSETHQTPEVEGEKENPGIIRSLASSLKSSASRIMNWFTNDQEEDWIAALQINPQEEFNDALDELKGQPALSERDVVLTLEDLGAFVWRGEISPQDYFDGLNELYATMPCYKKAIESISKSFLRSLSCIVEAQNKAKEDQRFAYEAARELPFSHEDIESIYPTTPKQLSFKGILKGVFQQLCRGFDYVIHNPGKALTLALMGQVAASAAFPLGEFQVNDNSSLPHIYPTTACFPNENGLVAWTCAKWNNSLEWDICIRGFNASTSEFGPQRSLNENTARDSTIIPIGNDTAIIGYNTYDGLNWRLSGRIISDLGELIGDKFDFSPNTTGWQFGGISFVKVLDDFFGAWMDSRGGSWDIWGERFSSNGTRLNPQRQLNPLSSSSQEYPSVGKAPNKSTHTVVWQTDEYGKWSISGGEFFQNSTAVNGTKSIFQNPAFDYKYPLVEILPNGNPFVICHRGQTGNWSIVGGEFDSDMMLVDDVIVISPFLISIQEPYREKFITLLQDYLFITWTAGTETDMDVVGLLLHFNKSFAGPQKTINQFKSWNQRYPSAAGISDSILEVWSGNQSGVYPQIWARFVPITEFFPTQTSTTSSTS